VKLKKNTAIDEQETLEMGYPNVTSLYFATPLAFNPPPDGGVSLGLAS